MILTNSFQFACLFTMSMEDGVEQHGEDIWACSPFLDDDIVYQVCSAVLVALAGKWKG